MLRLAYLVPAAVTIALAAIAVTWPRFGGWLLIAAGIAFTAWWWGNAAHAGASPCALPSASSR